MERCANIKEKWVEEATSFQISNEGNENPDWSQGYGYQFWKCRHNVYRGDGAFGQFCIVMPEQDAVIAITSGVNDRDIGTNCPLGTVSPYVPCQW